ncbi:MAG: type II toxin-antitoxin system ParD family antitoxin [Paracoccaceae bacterium]
MATIRKTITLSDNLDAWIKLQISRGLFMNDSEYIRDLLRRDQSQHDQISNLRQSISEGLESGVSEKSLQDIWGAAEDRCRDASG